MLLELATADIGNLVNLTDWAGLAQASRNTVGRYLFVRPWEIDLVLGELER